MLAWEFHLGISQIPSQNCPHHPRIICLLVCFPHQILSSSMVAVFCLCLSPGEENGNSLQYSCLGNPMSRGAWLGTFHGVTTVRHDLITKPSPPSLVISRVLVQFSCSLVSNSLQPHEPQHTRTPCLSPTPGVHPNPCPLSR